MSDSRQRRDVDRKLWDVILKYKEALADRQIILAGEREEDRRALAGVADRLETIPQQVLDSRAYLGLGRMQNAVARAFLAEGTTPSARMLMLARVVANLTAPVVFTAGRATVGFGRLEIESRTEVAREIEHESEEASHHQCTIPCRKIDPGEVQTLKRKLQRILEAGSSLAELRDRLDFEEAEYLSQMATAGELPLLVDGERIRIGKGDLRVSVALR